MAEQPTLSGIYEYLTGGTKYTEVDTQAGEYLRSLVPSISKWLTMIRNLIPAIAAELQQEGVTHVVDFASGVPINHIHNTLQDAKVVYSDINPHVVAEGQRLTADNPNVLYLQHDVNKPLKLVNSSEVKAFFGDIDKLAIGVSGVSAFLEPAVLQDIDKQLYDWAPSGTLFYSQFECKAADKITPKFQQFLDMMVAQLGAYNLYSEEQCQQSIQPWTLRHMTPVAEYLKMPSDYIQPEDHEDVDLQFYVAFAEKP